jgi:hypothetical protein
MTRTIAQVERIFSGSAGRIPDQGEDISIVLACSLAQIGLEFTGAKGGKGEDHIFLFLAGGFALFG